jgi:hypothetical protein
MLCVSRLVLCGSPDMIAYAPKTGGLIIQDWKTNGAAIDEPNTFNKFIVIDKWKIPYTKLHEYSLQLSFYAGILRRKGIEVDSNGWLIHFSDINPNYVLHKCVDYSGSLLQDVQVDTKSKIVHKVLTHLV